VSNDTMVRTVLYETGPLVDERTDFKAIYSVHFIPSCLKERYIG